MDNIEITMEELYKKVKEHMKDFTTEELFEWRNNLLETGQLNNDLLTLFNDELLDRACEKIEINNNQK